MPSSILDAAMPSSILDAAMPSSILDAEMPSSILDAAMPSSILDEAMPSSILDEAMPSVKHLECSDAFRQASWRRWWWMLIWDGCDDGLQGWWRYRASFCSFLMVRTWRGEGVGVGAGAESGG